MRLRDRLNNVAHWGFVVGLVAWITIRHQRPNVPTLWDMVIGFGVGVTVTFLLSLTRLGDNR